MEIRANVSNFRDALMVPAPRIVARCQGAVSPPGV
jgi:hypothetical protein